MENYKGFYKVNTDGCGVNNSTFYNHDTKECFQKIVWDIDRPYLNDNEETEILRFLPLNESARKQWLHDNGIVQEGDKIQVFKGRKIPKGTIATVTKIQPYYDCYHRWKCDYAYLNNGMRTNVNNCKLI